MLNQRILIILSAFLLSSILLVIYLSRSLAPTDNQAATVTSEELRQAGLFDVTHPDFGADKTGVTDSTVAIQRAMDRAYRNGGTTFFPPGTYRISSTLVALRERKVDLNYQLVGSTDGDQLPTILLTAGSFNDNNESNNNTMTYDGNKKAMIHMWGCEGAGEREGGVRSCDPPYEEQQNDVNKKAAGGVATMYSAVLRNLRFVMEPNNPDAIGVRVYGNQHNHVSNIEIEANGGFAGYYGTVGTNSFVQDLSVTGGKYGIYNGYGAWGAYSNVTLRNQELLAFTSPEGPPVSMSGFHIIKATAPAIGEIPGHGYNSTASSHEGSFGLNDGVIEFEQSTSEEAAINSPLDNQISVVNVFVKNAGKLLRAGSVTHNGNANGWSKINMFANTVPSVGYKLVNGAETQDDYVDGDSFVTFGVQAPNGHTLRMNHGIPDQLIESPDKLMRLAKLPNSGVVNVINEGITPVNIARSSSPDHSTKINEIINRPGVHTVFFPKGIYPIKNTVTLNANTKLIGLHPGFSRLEVHPDWKPNQIRDIVSTVDDANGRAVLAFIGTVADRGQNNNKFNNVHWRVGKNSVIYNVGRTGKNEMGCGNSTGWGTNNYWLWYTDNGGGRLWGGGALSGGCSRWSAEHRGILIDGTTQPLVIYGLNPEDGQGSKVNQQEGYMFEIRNARNVSTRSHKSENDNSVLIKNSQNIFILNLGGTVEASVRDSSNFAIMNVVAKFWKFDGGKNADGTPKPRRPKDLIDEIVNGNVVKSYKTTEALSIIKRGDLDLQVWNFAQGETDPPSDSIPPTNTPTPIDPSSAPTASATPSSTPPARLTNTPTSLPSGNACGKSDVDGDGKLEIHDFVAFAQMYGQGDKNCGDSQVDYGACGGRDVNRDGKFDILDFGGENIGFSQRYYPKTSCAL